MARKAALLYWGTKGAGSLVTRLLAEHLRGRDAELDLTVSVRRGNPDAEQLRASGIHVAEVDLGEVGSVLRSPLASARAYGSHLALFRRLRPDVVIVTMNSPLCAPFVLLLRAIGMSVAFIAHDAEPHPGDYHARIQRIATWVLMRCADTVVALSHAVERRLREERRCARSELLTIPLEALFPARPTPHAAMPPVGPISLLFLGRLLPYKGLSLLRDALASLRGRGDWRLTIAGDGPLAGWVRDNLSAWPDVSLELGWLTDARVDELVASHHILVCPYSEASQSGVVALALSQGLPVAVTPEGALPDQVAPVDPSLVARASTPEAFAEVVRAILDDPAKLGPLSDRARGLVRRLNQDRGWLDLIARAPAR